MHSQNVRRFSLWMSCLLLPAMAVAQSTLHVPGDYSTIAAAVAAANDCDTVEIAPGTYTESGIQVNTAITIRGAAPNHGAVTLDASSANLFYAFGVDSLRLENLTLQNGLAMANEIHPAYGDGGGAVLLVDTDFSASNCCFNDNQVQVRYQASRSIDMVPASGGAVYIAGSGSARLDNCHFSGNGITGNPGDATPGTLFRTGGALTVDGTLEMTACTFSDNYLYLTGDSDTAMGGALAAGSIVASDCSFEGNQIQLHGGTYLSAKGSAVYCAGDQFWQECRFLSNDFTSSGTPYGNVDGSALWGAGAFSASYSLFANNITYFRSSNEYTGGSAVRALTGEISNCTFYGNGSALSSASQGVPTVVAYFATELELGTSIFAQNIDAPVSIPAAGLLDVSCTDVYDNDRGDWSGSLAGLNGVDGNFSADPLFVAPTTEDFTLLPASPCQAANNSCGVVLGCQLSASDAHEILLVPAEYPSIAAAVAVALPGDEVLISAGIYNEHDIPIHSSVTIRGAVADSGAVVIDAQSSGRHFQASDLSSGIVLENLLLKNGSAPTNGDRKGGSLLLVNTPLSATNCDFVDCSATAGSYVYYYTIPYHAYGGAVYTSGTALAEFDGCGFYGNCVIGDHYSFDWGMGFRYHKGGAIFTEGALHLENCLFDDNSLICTSQASEAFGAAIFAESEIVGTNTTIRNTSMIAAGGSVLSPRFCRGIVSSIGSQSWSNCSFYNNSATFTQSPSGLNRMSGHLLQSDAQLTIEGSIFANNTATFAGGNTSLTGSLLNAPVCELGSCTMVANESVCFSTLPAVLIFAETALTLESSVFFANADSIASAIGSLEVLCCDSYANAMGNWNGVLNPFQGVNGNFSQDPAFCAAFEKDFHLQSPSPCLPANNSCGELIGALPQGCGPMNSISFSSPFPNCASGMPTVTGDEGVAVTVSTTTEDVVDAASLCMRVDYDGDGFDADAREQWQSLIGYSDNFSIRIEEALAHIDEVSENDIEVEFGARTTTETALSYYSVQMHIDRVAPDAISLSLLNNAASSVVLQFNSSSASDFAAYQIWISEDATIDAGDALWTKDDDPTLENVNTTQATVTNLAEGVGYWFAIEVIDQAGNVSALSNVAERAAVSGNVLHVPSEYSSIASAYASSDGGDLILLAAGTHICSNLSITHTISICGAVPDSGEVIVDGQNLESHFTVSTDTVSLHLSDLCLVNGRRITPDWGVSPKGGSVYFSGDVFTADNCNWSNNSSVGEIIPEGDYYPPDPYYQNAYGGAIYIDSATEVEIQHCGFNNSACLPVGNTAQGGAICSNVHLTLENCNFSASLLRPGHTLYMWGSTALGGAIYCTAALELVSCNFRGNRIDNNWTDGVNVRSKGAAVYSVGDLQLSSCLFQGNESINIPFIGFAPTVQGVSVFGEQSLDAEYCQFVGNSMERPWHPDMTTASSTAGWLIRADTIQLSNCSVHENTFVSSGGIIAPTVVFAETELTVLNSLLTANTGFESLINGSVVQDVSCTDIYGNSADWVGDLAPFASINGNLSVDPLYVNAPYDLHLQEASPCLPGNNSCGVLMGALGEVPGSNILNVPAQFETVSAALSASSAGNTILIAAGQYDCSNLQIPHSITIQGAVADSGAVVLDAQNNGRHFRVNNASTSLHLANLCLVNGRSTASWGSSPQAGSIYFAGDSLSAENCCWVNNRSVGIIVWGGEYGDESFYQDAYGGAIFIQSATSAELNECHFYNSACYADNTIARGGAIYSNTPLTLSSCDFIESLLKAGPGEFEFASHSEGAAIYCATGVELDACLFDSNSIDLGYHSLYPHSRGAGVFAGGNVLVDSCAFKGNGIDNASGFWVGQGMNGMAIYTSQLLNAQNSQFVENHSTFNEEAGDPSTAVGFALYGGLVELDHCTVHGNAFEGDRFSPSVVSAETSCQITNCILSANVGTDSPASSSGSMSVSCTDSYGNFSDWTGDLTPFASINGNLSLDPLYADAPEDLRLQAASPCLPENNSCGVQMGALGAAPEILMVSDLCAVANGEDIFLSWTDPNPALNDSFEIHHGSSQGFVPGPETLVGTTTTTQYTFSPECQDCVGFLRVVAVSQPISELDRSKRRLSASSRRMQE